MQEKPKGFMLISTAIILCAVMFVAGFLGGMMAKEHALLEVQAQYKDLPPDSSRAQVPDQPKKTADSFIIDGNFFYDSGEYDKAIAAYGKALEIQPDNADVLTDMGTMYRAKKMPQKAIECYEKALLASPLHGNAAFNKGFTLLADLEKPTEAMNFWRKILAVKPDLLLSSGKQLSSVISGVFLDVSRKMESENKRDLALLTYDELLKFNPKFLPALLYSAELLEKMNRTSEALPRWKRILQIQPDAADSQGKSVSSHIPVEKAE